ncbi:DUF6204 family protein [Streptomyces sp. NPDC049954]|uniref:DUF6204 family protein n=1 Tax=Streptomyces sp. NPDC049954 TaxID=3155779 RepID=UPI00342FB403
MSERSPLGPGTSATGTSATVAAGPEQHTYRVIVRGVWDGLTDAARAELLAGADQARDLAAMRFTEEGSLSYDRTLKPFSYRFELRSAAEDGEEMAAALAEERVETELRRRGFGYRDLRSTVTDLDTMKINRERGR